jgi:hypothetical protein
MTYQSRYLDFAAYDDHMDELIEAGPFAHGAALSTHTLRANMCQCRVCEDRRRVLGIPGAVDEDGCILLVFIDAWGRIAGCSCPRCTLFAQ